MAEEDIDSLLKTQCIHHFGDTNLSLSEFPVAESRLSDPLKKPYKITYPSTLDSQIKRLRISLESWKEIILPVKRVLLWEKNWHPTALVGSTTIIFTLIWLLDPSILTILATIGLIVTISDYFVPSLVSTIFKNEKWTTSKERELDDVCSTLIMFKAKLDLYLGSYYRMRTQNPKMYIILTLGSLALLAWLGCIFNNLFLVYVNLTFLLLVPGLEHHDMLVKVKSATKIMMASFLDNAKTKITDTKSNLCSKKIN